MRKIRTLVSIFTAAALISLTATGCAQNPASSSTAANTAVSSASTASAASGGPVNITFFNSKPEIATQLEAAVKAFNSANKDGITVTVSNLNTSSTVDAVLTSKYASGSPYTLNMVDAPEIETYADKAMDLSNETWVKTINSKMVDTLKVGGKIMAFPFAVEGDGLIYNKNTIEKATGKRFDPTQIKSLPDLENLYKQIQAGGVTPVQISHDDWSLANHFLTTAINTQSDSAAYIKGLKSGSNDIASNETYQGLLKVFNLNMKYNIYKSSPMSSDYTTTDPTNIATGKVAFWFNGQWTMSNIKQFLTGSHAKDEFGFLPLFADSATSKSISAGVTKAIFVDNTKSTDAQKKAANEFLNWLVNDEAGQKALVTDMGIIPAFTNITLKPSDDLSKSIANYMSDGNIIAFNTISGDFYTKVGAYLQQYLVGKMDSATLSKSIDGYFKSSK
jgi:raffinose/stachyose/melibiose transport system substrate-binding protein